MSNEGYNPLDAKYDSHDPDFAIRSAHLQARAMAAWNANHQEATDPWDKLDRDTLELVTASITGFLLFAALIYFFPQILLIGL